MSFESWYAVYPKKTARRDAEKAYGQQLKAGFTPQQLFGGVKAYASLMSSKGIDKQFIPHPATWLRGQRWLDEDLHPHREDTPLNLFTPTTWDGKADKLIREIGASSFSAYFGNARYECGPPAKVIVQSPFMVSTIERKYRFVLARCLGDIEVVAGS